MTLAQRIGKQIERGQRGLLFWWGVASQARFVDKRLTYHFPDGSRLIRDYADSENEAIRVDWPARD